MARRATSLDPKPSLFLFCFVLFFCCFFVFLGPPHLTLNPPFFVFFFFPFFASNVFPLRKGHFCLLLRVSLCFSLAFFGLPLFQFLFLCLSLVIFFIFPSCLSFLLSFHSLFFSLYFLFFLLCFCFMKGTTSKN